MPREDLIPQDVAAEQSVLGAILMDPQAKFQVIDLLTEPGMFFKERHADIYRAILAVDVPDSVTVSSELNRVHKLGSVGGDAYLTELVGACPSSVYARHHAQIVQRMHILRSFMTIPDHVRQAVYSPAEDVDHVFGKILAAVQAVQPNVKDGAVLEWADSIQWYFDVQIEREMEQEHIESGEKPLVDFPWTALSNKKRIRRLRPGTLTVIDAESGHGKTSFAECCAEHWAKKGLSVLFFHFELSHEVMIDRRTARHTGLSIDELDAGVNINKLGAYSDKISKWIGNITYIHSPGWTAHKLAAFCEKRAASKRIDAIVVDYFQKMAYETNKLGLTSAQARGQQAEAIKNMAERMGVPVLTLSQLNREGKIRDTKELEEKCNLMIKLDRPLLNDDLWVDGKIVCYKGKPTPYATVVIEKNTFGDAFNGNLFFNGLRYQWGDVARVAPMESHPLN